VNNPSIRRRGPSAADAGMLLVRLLWGVNYSVMKLAIGQIPAHIRRVIRSRPTAPPTRATTVGTVARMSELLVALVRASPRMNAS
jgi:hypothetical protein